MLLIDFISLVSPVVRAGFNRTRTVSGRKEPLMPLDAVRFYSANIILALAHFHRHSIVYRNLRAENVLIDRNGFLRLISTGQAKELPYRDANGMDVTKTRTMCGSTEYMAPEMVEGRGYDKAVDVWALGILMHEMLTGETPFTRFGQVLVGSEKQWLPDADKRIMAKIATLANKVWAYIIMINVAILLLPM